MPDEEVESQRSKITWTPLVRRDLEYHFCECLITDETGVPDLSFGKGVVLAKVSSLFEVLRLGGSNEFVEQIWTQICFTASCMNIEVCWSLNEVRMSIRFCSV